MTTARKPSEDYDRFTSFMDKLAKVPHSELKADLDKEKAEKKQKRKAKKTSSAEGTSTTEA
jgi:hypothetical protein